MFKSTLKVLVLSLFCIQSFGQIKPRLFEFGPKAGLNIAGMATKDTIQYSKKLSMLFQAGIFTRLNVGKFSLQPEFIYQIKGGNFKTPQAKYSYKYLSTPILLGFTPIKGIYLETGPELNWALNQNYKKDGYTVYGPEVKNDNCWVVGTRINMLDMFSLMSLNIRYTYGLNNIMTSYNGLTPYDHRTRTLQVSFTYTLSEYLLWYRKHHIKKK